MLDKQVLGGVRAVRSVGHDLGRPTVQTHELKYSRKAFFESQKLFDGVRWTEPVPSLVVTRPGRHHELAGLSSVYMLVKYPKYIAESTYDP